MENGNYLSALRKCVRCGGCKSLCPTYDEAATESMGARGRIALLWGLASGIIPQTEEFNKRLFSCMLCGACSGLCPSGVDIPELMYHARVLLRNADGKRKLLRFMITWGMKKKNLVFSMLRTADQVVFPYLRKKKRFSFLPELPDIPLERGPVVYPLSKRKGRVAIFAGCMVNYVYPHLGESLINILHTLGYEVILPAGEACCGRPFRSLGLEDEAKQLAQKNLEAFGRLNVEAVLTLCPSCALSLSREYVSLVGTGVANTIDISSFFSEKIGQLPIERDESSLKRVVFHDPCHLKYGLGVEREPRRVLEELGIEVANLSGSRCCGFAGTFRFSNEELSERLLDKCIEQFAVPNETIVTSCPGCMLQLSGSKGKGQVLHLVEVIEELIAKEAGISTAQGDSLK